MDELEQTVGEMSGDDIQDEARHVTVKVEPQESCGAEFDAAPCTSSTSANAVTKMNGSQDPHAHQSPNGPYYNAASVPPAAQSTPQSGDKRKSHDSNNNTPDGTQGRAKRNRYISIACNECKRRKIKCNGNNPCHRCGRLSLECIYATNGTGTDFKESE